MTARLLATALCLLAACGGGPPPVDIVAAASLRGVLEAMRPEFQQRLPGREIRIRTGGSRVLAREVAELQLAADVVLLADPDLLREMLVPGWTDFGVDFAGDAMVVAFTENSVRAAEITVDNWVDVLLDPAVQVGMADPQRAPAGYRALLTLELAQQGLAQPIAARLRERIGQRGLRPDVAELLAPLQTGSIDFAFLYASTARAAGLRALALPAEFDLSRPEYAERYGRVEVRLDNSDGSVRTIGGAPIRFGGTAARDSPSGLAVLAALLSSAGRRALQEHGFVAAPPVIWGEPSVAQRGRLEAALAGAQ